MTSGHIQHLILKGFKGEDAGRHGEGETIEELCHRKWTEIRSGSIDLAKKIKCAGQKESLKSDNTTES